MRGLLLCLCCLHTSAFFASMLHARAIFLTEFLNFHIMKRFILILLIIPCFTYAQSDIFNGVFIVPFGITRADAIISLQTHQNVSGIKRMVSPQVNYVHNQNFFIGDIENITLLVFDNDKLWQQNLRLFYKKGEGQLCLDKFQSIVNSYLKDKRYTLTKYIVTNPVTEEKIGDRIELVSKTEPNDKMYIFYYVNYNKDNSIDYYQLDVQYFNLKYKSK
jgi:hypothetical protein